MTQNKITLKLGFDKVTLTASPASYAEYHDFDKSLKNLGLNHPDIATFASFGSSNGYRLSLRLVSECWTSIGAPLLQAAPYDKNKPYFRLEFNPNRIGIIGIEAVKAFLEGETPHGWALFQKHARASRIDVNVDAGGLPVGDVLVRARYPRTTEIWSSKGDLESLEFGEVMTVYAGKKSASKKLYRVYALAADKVPAGFDVATRFEAVDSKTRPMLSELQSYAYPFANLIARSVLAPPPKGWPKGRWKMFMQFAADHGLEPARALLTPEERQDADAVLAAHPIADLDFKTIWMEWPKLVTCLGIQASVAGCGASAYASELKAA